MSAVLTARVLGKIIVQWECHWDLPLRRTDEYLISCLISSS